MIVEPNTNARILGPVQGLYYYDKQSARLPKDMTALEIWNAIMRDPQPLLSIAFWLRDLISSVFGVKRIGGFTGTQVTSVSVGQYLDFFRVEDACEDCLALTERDRHLDVMTCISIEYGIVSVTSSVCVHNVFGRVYMLPVGIAHRWIVRAMLKRLC